MVVILLLLLLLQIESNLGITLDNETTPMLPPYLPPTMIFLPWVVKVLYTGYVYNNDDVSHD